MNTRRRATFTKSYSTSAKAICLFSKLELFSDLDRENEAAIRAVGGEELPLGGRARCSEGGQDGEVIGEAV